MILLTGASGRIGQRVATLLHAAGSPLRLMSRQPDNAGRLEGVDVVHGDFEDPTSLVDAFAGIDRAVVISGKAPPGARALTHRNAFEAARRAGVNHVVYLSLKGASASSRFPYCRDHHDSEAFLAATGLPNTSLRVAFYIDMFVDKFGRDGVIRGPGGGTSGAFISREDTARAIAAVALNPPGGILDVTGPELLDIAAVTERLSALIGRSLRYGEEAADATRQRLRQANAPVWLRDLEAGWFEAIAAGEQTPATPTYRHLVGDDPETLETYFGAFPHRLDALRELGTAR